MLSPLACARSSNTSRLRSCECNSYHYRIVKEQMPWHAAPEEQPPLVTASSRIVLCFVGRVRRPADQESQLAFESGDPHPAQAKLPTILFDLSRYSKNPFTGRQQSFFCFFSLSRKRHGLWRRPGSNRQPPACKTGALPIELRPREWAYLDSNQGPQLYQSCALAN